MFILAALCLVAAGVGICKETVMGIRCDTNARLSIDMWDDEGQNDKVKGQYYIFLSSMVLAFLTMGNLLMMITRHPRAKAVVSWRLRALVATDGPYLVQGHI